MKLLLILLVGLLLTPMAAAEGLLPADAGQVSEESLGAFRLLRLETDAGETMALLLDAMGAPVSLTTLDAPEAPGSDTVQSAEGASAAARTAFPGALILASDLMDDGSRAVRIAAKQFLGTVWVRGDALFRRELIGGRFLNDQGRLTLEGALRVAQYARPEAVFTAIEYDSDDGLYEGEAQMDGVEYEFALEAATGRLVQWERD